MQTPCTCGVIRGAVYGNFSDKEELLLASLADSRKQIVPKLDPSMSLKQQMRILRQAVANQRA